MQYRVPTSLVNSPQILVCELIVFIIILLKLDTFYPNTIKLKLKNHRDTVHVQKIKL